MANPFIAEIRMFGCNFAPVGWLQCNGQILPISQYTALFSLLGTTYGGNGTSTFGIPNLQGRAAVNMGQGPGLSNYFEGQIGGSSSVSLLASQLPAHTHSAIGDNGPGTSSNPVSSAWATPSIDRDIYFYDGGAGALVTMNAGALSNSGGGQPHNNLMPFLVVNFCIAIQGIFPSRN
jgi:microcystin-dependent protein